MSVSVSKYPVMPVVNTTSPVTLPAAPIPSPSNTRPFASVKYAFLFTFTRNLLDL